MIDSDTHMKREIAEIPAATARFLDAVSRACAGRAGHAGSGPRCHYHRRAGSIGPRGQLFEIRGRIVGRYSCGISLTDYGWHRLFNLN